MQGYMTRRLIAAQEMTYCQWPLRPGDEFFATPVDAEYLLRNKRATEAPEAPALVEPEHVQQVAEPERIEPAEPAGIEQETIPAAEPAKVEADSVEVEPVRTRRPYVRRKAADE